MRERPFAETGQLPGVLLVVGRHEREIAARLRVDLRRRGFAVNTSEARTEVSLDPDLVHGDVISVVVVPYDSEAPAKGERMLNHVEVIARQARPAIVLADRNDPRVSRTPATIHAIVRFGEGPADYDRVFADLFTALLGPFPPWLEVRVHPSQITAPTGVSWWSDDVVVADEHFGQVVHLSPQGERVLVAGLSEPHHVHLDRSKLLVANTGGHRLLTGTVVGDSLGDIQTLMAANNKRFVRPNGVHQSHGVCAIADTDSHRICISRDDLWTHESCRWTNVQVDGGLKYPCGVYLDRQWLWIADTFNHRVVACSHDGHFIREFVGYGWELGRFAYPVAVARWRNWLLVADAEAQRVQALSIATDDHSVEPYLSEECGVEELGAPFIGDPFGLCVNRNGRLAVTDRQRRCVWLLDLQSALPTRG